MIELSISDRVGRLTIRRPAAGNAFTREMVGQCREALRRASGLTDILTISGEGADFTIGRDRQEAPHELPPYAVFEQISDLNQLVSDFPGIVIASVRGRAFGLGVGVIMRSDLAIASEDAHFALDEVKLGFPPMFIMEEILEHVPKKRALDMILSGREFTSGEALEIGLLSRVVPPDRLDEAVDELVGELRTRDPRVLLVSKHYLKSVDGLPREARSAYALVQQTRFATARPR